MITTNDLNAKKNVFMRFSAFIIGALIPFILFFSTKSVTLFVGIASLFAIIGLYPQKLQEMYFLRFPISPVAILFAAFFIHAGLSVAWTASYGIAARTVLGMVLAVGVSLVVAICYRQEMPYRFGFGIAIALLLASAYALIEFRSGITLRRLVGLRNQPFVFNRSMIYQGMLIWPMLLLIERRLRWLAVAAALSVIITSICSDSGAAVFGLFVGAICAVSALVIPRLILWLMASGTTAYIAIAPWLGNILEPLKAYGLLSFLKDAHAAERIEIWKAFGQFYWQQPLLGIGIGASEKASLYPGVLLVDPALQGRLNFNHPHNAFLQVWVELGAVGAVLFGTLCAALIMTISTLPTRSRVLATGMAGAMLVITAVSHGAWQAWWITTITTIAGIFWASNRETS